MKKMKLSKKKVLALVMSATLLVSVFSNYVVFAEDEDPTLPVLTVETTQESLDAWTNEDVEIVCTATDDSAVTGVYYKLGESDEEEKLATKSDDPETPDTYVISLEAGLNYVGSVIIYCKDDDENISSEYTIDVKMDNEKPVVESAVANTSEWTNGDVTINATVSDNLSGVKNVKYSFGTTVDQEAVLNAETGEYTITIPACDYAGDVVVYCEDNAGNVSDESAVAVKMDVTAPTEPVIAYDKVANKVKDDYGYFNDKVVVTVTAEDNNELDKIEYSTDEENYIAGTLEDNKISFEIEPQYVGKVTAKAYDKAGNVSGLVEEGKDSADVSMGGIVLDDVKPVGEVKVYSLDDEGNKGDEIAPVDNKTYEKNGVMAVVKITEVNFDNSAEVTINDDEIITLDENTWTEVEDEADTYEASFKIEDEGEYSFKVNCKDLSGNEMEEYVSDEIIVDKTVPVISVTKESEGDNTGKYYDSAVDVTIEIEEKYFDAESVVISGESGFESTAFKQYVNNINNWNVDAENPDKYVLVYPFAEGKYKFDVEYTDIAGNVAEKVEVEEFIIDTTAPSGLELTYELIMPTWKQWITDNYFYSATNQTIIVKFKATDAESGIKSINYFYERESGVSDSIRSDFDCIVDEWADELTVDKLYQAPGEDYVQTILEIPMTSQLRGNISFTATNNAGMESDSCLSMNESKERIDIIENVAPVAEVSFEPDVTSSDGSKYYFKKRAEADITIEETNFFKEDVELYLVEGENETRIDNSTLGWTKADGGRDKHNTKYTIQNEGDYKLKIKYTDKSGNEMEEYVSPEIRVDITAPVIKTEDIEKYNKNNVEFPITITEHNFDASKVEILNFVAKNVEDNDIATKDAVLTDLQAAIKDASNWENEAGTDEYKFKYTFSTDAIYSFDIKCTDIPGNEKTKSVEEFVVDKAAPTDLSIEYEEIYVDADKQDIIPKTWNEDDKAYYSYNPAIKITVKAIDEISGVKVFICNYTREARASEINVKQKQWTLIYANGGKNAEASFIIPIEDLGDVEDIESLDQYRGSFGFTAYDNAGNSTELNDSNRVNIIDTIKPKREVSYSGHTAVYKKDVMESIPSKEFEETDNVIIYSNDTVTATFKVTEANFYAEDVKLSVKKDGVAVEGAQITDWTKNGDVYTGTYTLSEEGEYDITLNYTDRSGNKMDEYVSQEICIDKTAPVIDVEYPTDKKDTDTDKYYERDVEVLVTVNEHNFDAKKVEILNFVAKDAAGADIATMADVLADLQATINDASNWDNEAGTDVHTFKYTFATEAVYSFDVKCIDIPGNDATKSVNEFVVDKTAPANLKIEYEEIYVDEDKQDIIPKEWDENNKKYYAYNPAIKITVKATDETAGIKDFVCTYTREDGASKIKNVAAKEWPEEDAPLTFTANGKEAEAWFVIPVSELSEGVDLESLDQYRGSFSFTVTDNAGYKSELNDSERVNIVDTITPKREKVNSSSFEGITAVYNADTMEPITSKEFNEGDNVIPYSNKDVTVTFKITEANFYAEDVKLTVTRDGVEVPDTEITAWNHETETDVYTGTYTLSEQFEGDYVIKLNYTDRSGNKMDEYVSQEIHIDKTAPVFEIQYPTDKTETDTDKYYERDVEVLVTVNEHNFDAKNIEVLNFKAKDAAGNDIATKADVLEDFQNALNTKSNWTDGDTEDEYKLEYTFTTDAVYSFDLKCTDIPGNVSDEYPIEEFVVDKTVPTGLAISYEAVYVDEQNKDVIPKTWSQNDKEYNAYNPAIKITVKATDETAGIKEFICNYTREDGASEINVEEKQWILTYFNGGKEAEAEFVIPLNEIGNNVNLESLDQYRGSFNFTAYDNAGNSSSIDDSGRVNIIDTIKPTRTVTLSEANQVISNKAKDNTLVTAKNYKYDSEDQDYVLYYSGKTPVLTFKITEANFYREDVKLTVTKDGVAVPGIQITDWKQNGDVWTGTYTLTQGEGDYIVTMDYTDRSANAMQTYTSPKIVIDKTLPIITVKYDENELKNTIIDSEENDRKYYAREHGATVTIKEHNFRADDVVIKIKAKDINGNNVEVAEFTFDKDGNIEEYANLGKNRNTWSAYDVNTFRRADDTYVMDIDYLNDANYTFDIEYKDLAMNNATDYDADYFTVDTKKPEKLTIKYSENVFENVLNKVTFGYYAQQMKVTISAKDNISGINEFVYSYINNEGVSKVNAQLLDEAVKRAKITFDENDKSIASKTFTIPKAALGNKNQFNGTVEFTAYDRSKNEKQTDDDTNIIVDNIAPVADVTFNDPTKELGGVSYYDSDITATINIEEANFFSEDVVVSVTKDDADYPVNVDWTDNSVDSHTGTFTLTEDGDYFVNVEYADRSTNEMQQYTSEQLTIDTHEPVIRFSNLAHQSAHNEDKIGFTVTVTDENIDESYINTKLYAVVKKEKGDNQYEYEKVSLDIELTDKSDSTYDDDTYTYTIDNLDTDGYYSFECEVTDYANHIVNKIAADKNDEDDESDSDEGIEVSMVNFSVNREGSVFWISTQHNDKYNNTEMTDKLNGAYANDAVTVVLHEINVDKVNEDEGEKKTVFTLNNGSGAEDIELVEKDGANGNYEKNIIVGEGGWYENIYTLDNSNFVKDGAYSLNIITYDKADNSNINTKSESGMINFVVDRTQPVISSNIKNGQSVKATAHTVEFKVSEVNLDESTVVVKLNGSPVQNVEAVGNNTYAFKVTDGLNHNVEILAKDLAGNESPLYQVANFTVSTNWLVLWYANTFWFWGSIGGVLVLAGAITAVIVLKKRKKKTA